MRFDMVIVKDLHRVTGLDQGVATLRREMVARVDPDDDEVHREVTEWRWIPTQPDMM